MLLFLFPLLLINEHTMHIVRRQLRTTAAATTPVYTGASIPVTIIKSPEHVVRGQLLGTGELAAVEDVGVVGEGVGFGVDVIGGSGCVGFAVVWIWMDGVLRVLLALDKTSSYVLLCASSENTTTCFRRLRHCCSVLVS
ncbi:hypothetical protein IWX48DRAFT_604381 [Phyllosticta citricarpa]